MDSFAVIPVSAVRHVLTCGGPLISAKLCVATRVYRTDAAELFTFSLNDKLIGFCKSCCQLRSVVFATRYGGPLYDGPPPRCLPHCPAGCGERVVCPRLHYIPFAYKLCIRHIIDNGGGYLVVGAAYPVVHVDLTRLHSHPDVAEHLRWNYDLLCFGRERTNQYIDDDELDYRIRWFLSVENSMPVLSLPGSADDYPRGNSCVNQTWNLWDWALSNGMVDWGQPNMP